MSGFHVQTLCEKLASNKVTERKKAYENFMTVLKKVETIEDLNKSGERSWHLVLTSVHNYLKKEANKALEDQKNKGNKGAPAKVNDIIFFETVDIITRKGRDYDIKDILECISDCLVDEGLNQYCTSKYLKSLRITMLPIEDVRCHIQDRDWDLMYKRLLKSFNNDFQFKMKFSMDVLENLSLFIRYGPLHGFSSEILREQFDFVSQLCTAVQLRSEIRIQLAIVEIVYYFCLHTSKDNRMSCCKLGEETFCHLYALYDILNPRLDGMKILLIKYFLMQLVLHNPRGISEDHPVAYAYNWETWNHCLKAIHKKIVEDITNSMKEKRSTNPILFLIDKETTYLQEDFARLFAEVIKQMEIQFHEKESDAFHGESKRKKMCSPVTDLINIIQQRQQWAWINIMCTLIHIYPDVLNEENFINLLQILSKLQVDCQDNTVARHIYCCLYLLKDLEPSLELCDNSDVTSTWNIICDTTLRSFGLNQNVPWMHSLLQKLIFYSTNLNPEIILRTYTSEVLDVTEDNLKTLHITFNSFNCPHNVSQNHLLIKWILIRNNFDNYIHLANPITARVLVGLIVQKYPSDEQIETNHVFSKNSSFDDIAEIYLKSAFEDSFFDCSVNKISEKNEKKRKIALNNCSFTFLIETLQILVEHVQESRNNMIRYVHIIALIKNVISYMLNFELLEINDLNQNILLDMMVPIFEKVNYHLKKCYIDKDFDDLNIKTLTECLICFHKIFSTVLNPVFDEKIRKIIPTNLLDTIISFLNTESREKKSDFKDFRLPLQNLRIVAIKAVVTFCCGLKTFSSCNQKIKFVELAEKAKIHLSGYKNYEWSRTFFKTLGKCQLQCLDAASITAAIAVLSVLCEKLYKYYTCSVEILQFIYDILPHVVSRGCSNSKNLITSILQIFYTERNHYGPGFYVQLVNCIGKLYQCDPECESDDSDSRQIILKLPEFLCNQNQEVRFAAVKNIIIFFEVSSSRKNLADYQLQELIFEDICNKCEKVFEVEGSLTEERKIDETVTRSASVLHTLSVILIVSNQWRENSLFALFKIVHKFRLESFSKVLRMISKTLHLDHQNSLLDQYLKVILGRWIREGFSFYDFPISLFGCEHRINFYTKYILDVVPYLIEFDTAALNEISDGTGMMSILEESFPVVIVNTITSSISYLCQDTFENNKVTLFLRQHIEEGRFKALFIEKIDKILLSLVSTVKDEKDFSNKYHISIMFSNSYNKGISLQDFDRGLKFLEEIVCPGKNLMSVLFTQHVDKLQRVTMQLNTKIHDCIAIEDKLRVFHHYSIMNGLIIENFSLSISRNYFIRDTFYVHIRFIKNCTKCPELTKVAIVNLKNCLVQLLEYSDVICKHFGTIVSTLVDIVVERENEGTAELSLDILKFLIIENTQQFRDIIKQMDNFPKHQLLSEIARVRSDLKYGGKESHLEEEIRNFVNFRNVAKGCFSRVDSLRHLKVHLFCEKRQLRKLYGQLSDLKGFSDDCENSLLHQLIGILVDLSISDDKDTSMEALKCLGELGPSDLMTLVVRSEKHFTCVNSTPFEFFTGQIISLLNMYLIDVNVQLVKPSAEILYNALNTKEGRKVSESNEDFGSGIITGEYLSPFFVVKKPKAAILKVDIDQLVCKINSDELWCPSVHIEYDTWIRNLICNILETITDSYIPQLISICNLKVEFCEVLLPSLIYLLVSRNNDNINEIVTGKINKFFEVHWSTAANSTNLKNNLIIKNKKAVQVMLNVVHFVRVNKSKMKSKKHMEDLDLNYLKIAKAAQYCSAYFTSLLYVEMWCHSRIEMQTTKAVSFKNTILDLIQETETEDISLAIINIMRSSYKAIGDHDSLQGCGTSLLLNPQLRIEYYQDSGMWDQAMLCYNMQMSQNIPNSKQRLMNSFKQCGLYETSLLCKDQFDMPDYECMWRLSNWSLPDTKRPVQNQITFEDQMEQFKYFALKSVHERDEFGVMEYIENARLLIVEKLKQTTLESSSNLYSILTYLQGLNEIEEFLNAESIEDMELVLKKWSRQDDIEKNDFIHIEPIMSQRMIILNDYFKQSAEPAFYKNHLINLSLKLSEKSRLKRRTHIGMRALAFIQNLPQLTQGERSRIFLEDAQLCWESDNKLTGRKILSQLSGDENVDPRLRSLALKLNGKWGVESCSEHPNAIIKDYFMASLELYEDLDRNRDNQKSLFDTYDILARFADGEYQQVTSHMASDVFQKKMKNMLKAEEAAKQLSRRTSLTLDERKAKAFHDKQSSIDQAEIKNTKNEKNNFLRIALRFYLLNLSQSDDNNLQIYRVMALFLENRTSDIITELIEEYIPSIPSYKFITILPQLIPHIANRQTEDTFSQLANNIIERCAREHPHHTLPIILALANSYKDTEYNGSKTKLLVNTERIVEAKKLIKSLKNNSILTGIISRLEIVSDALVELAYLAPTTEHANRKDEKRFDIPKKSKIMSIKNFGLVPVFTDSLPIHKDRNYDNIVAIHSYEKYYDLVGGLNLPKKIICIGTDGKPREQLVKGQDDLRQDAVMQQVFTIMNSLLSLDKQTCGLKIRTYKVVPLSIRSGILEWAKNTIPVGAYLTGEKGVLGAHQIHRPQDKSPSACRSAIAGASKQNVEQKLKVFNEICENFKPVFHKFFEDNFLHPTVWYERRRAYIHSVATSSMCGYILGIGDRHVSNILIDKITAEVVHIDFGIAFEQGRILPTPETVPFRLTRDFVDAMGISGVEGAFKRSCEKTMTVMRHNYQTIMAILGVLLYDPLYSWTVSAAEASKRQRGSLDETTNFRTSPQVAEAENISINTTAERALLRLKAKLHGIEEGTPKSVENQVGVLIHQAMDPANLCRLFQGWQAYL